MSLRSTLLLAPLALTATLRVGNAADTVVIPVTVTADHDTVEAPVTFEVSPFKDVPVTGSDVTPCQLEPAPAVATSMITWFVPAMKKGDKRTFYLAPAKTVTP